MHKRYYSILIAFAFALSLNSCGPTPAGLAEECRRLNKELAATTNDDERDSLYREIAAIESEARQSLTKTEFKEYARLAHPNSEATDQPSVNH